MTLSKTVFLISIVTIFVACDPSSTHIKVIVNESKTDVKLNFTGEWAKQLGDSVIVKKNTNFQLYNEGGIGDYSKTPCKEGLDSLNISLAVPSGKRLNKQLFNDNDWETVFVERKFGGSDQQCLFKIKDSDFQ
jgi:hypothetical protein